MATTFAERKAIGQDTIARSASIVQSVPGASLDSIFFHEQIPAESLPAPDAELASNPPVRVKVVNSDSFTVARRIMKEYPEAEGKTTVLNLASDAEPAGGWAESFYRTQVCNFESSSSVYQYLRALEMFYRKKHSATRRPSTPRSNLRITHGLTSDPTR